MAVFFFYTDDILNTYTVFGNQQIFEIQVLPIIVCKFKINKFFSPW